MSCTVNKFMIAKYETDTVHMLKVPYESPNSGIIYKMITKTTSVEYYKI